MEPTHRVLGHLRQAEQANRERKRLLDAVARGDVRLAPAEREEMLLLEKERRRLLGDLVDHSTPLARVVSMEEAGSGTGDRLPKALSDSYALLVHAAYGSDPAVSIGDSSVIRGLGKRSPRTSTNQSPDVIGASRKTARRPGIATRQTIRDRRSYELKLRTDRKLRRIAEEISAHLNGEEVGGRSVNSCSRCARIGEDDWAWCPACGHAMEKRED